MTFAVSTLLVKQASAVRRSRLTRRISRHKSDFIYTHANSAIRIQFVILRHLIMPVHQFSIIRVRIKANVSNVVVYLLTCLRKTVYPKLLWSKPTLFRPGSSLIKKLFHFKVCKISPDMHVNLVTKSKAVNHLCCYKLQENAT